MDTITRSVDLTTIHCGQCGGTYAISEVYREEKWMNGGFWNCPYCRVGWGYVESENKRLRDRLAREQHHREQAEEEARQQKRFTAAARGQVTKLKNRVGRGVCPCCNRTFQNLADHMAGQHPDWAPEVLTEEARDA